MSENDLAALFLIFLVALSTVSVVLVVRALFRPFDDLEAP